MTDQDTSFASAKRITTGILITLAGINFVWGTLTASAGPFIGFAFYLLVAMICRLRRHFQAAALGGILGFLIHLYELFICRIDQWDGADLALLLNVLLPVPLVYYGFKAYTLTKHPGTAPSNKHSGPAL